MLLHCSRCSSGVARVASLEEQKILWPRREGVAPGGNNGNN